MCGRTPACARCHGAWPRGRSYETSATQRRLAFEAEQQLELELAAEAAKQIQVFPSSGNWFHGTRLSTAELFNARLCGHRVEQFSRPVPRATESITGIGKGLAGRHDWLA